MFMRDTRNSVDFQSGSRAVIFKVLFEGRKYAMKCYTKTCGEQERRLQAVANYLNGQHFPALSRVEFRPQELYIYDDWEKGAYWPVWLAEWTEGMTLRSWLAEKCAAKDCKALAQMARRFAELGVELLAQEWAHGDLKPENILVTPECELKLIDYDSTFVPVLAGMTAPELGTPGFQHPLRDARFYDRNLDDYSIALITTALHALTEFPEWYDAQDDDRLLFDPVKAVEGRDTCLQRLRGHWLDRGQTALYKLASLPGNPSPVLPGLAERLKGICDTLENRPTAATGEREIYRSNGFYGYRGLTEAIYDDAAPFVDGLALVRLGKKRYYIDTTAQKRLDVSAYDRADSFSEGLACVQKGRKWGYIDTAGARVIEPRFDSALDFREGAAVVRSGDRFGYIDRQGNWLVEPIYSFATPFRNGMATGEVDGQTVLLKLSELK